MIATGSEISVVFHAAKAVVPAGPPGEPKLTLLERADVGRALRTAKDSMGHAKQVNVRAH